jgi:amino acid transporter
MSLLTRLLFGRTIANREAQEHRLGVWEAVPAMGLDALGSSAYGPEAMLAILLPLGAQGLAWVSPLTIAIVALLAILYLSYRQTLQAYPGNGGAYPVVKANLGETAGLLAASALVVDYILNVAVGIAAGAAALVSIVPALLPHTLALCLALLCFIALANLRGTMEASRIFAIPVYIFLASFFFILVWGGLKTAAASGHPVALVAPYPLGPATAGMGAWLLLRAFASGCTAMTGVEAVSNSMGAFRSPVLGRARATLGLIVGTLAVLLLGIGWLVHVYRIGAMNEAEPGYRSILAQLAGAVAGHNLFYYIAVGSALAILALSANTSFTAFPRLCRMLAQDGFLPRPFALVGRRLVNTFGIVYLAGSAAALLILFGGITDRLIPLFAIGAFLTFTLSQTAMTVHWHRAAASGDSGARPRMAINAAGASATTGALCIIVVAKFSDGAWISLLAVPLVIMVLRAVRHYYDDLYRAMQVRGSFAFAADPPLLLVAVESWSEPVRHALALAVRMSPDVVALHLTADGLDSDGTVALLRAQWPQVEETAAAAGRKPPRLCMIPAPDRRLDKSVLDFINHLQLQERPVAVLIPQLVPRHWWEVLLHTGRANRLRRELLRHGTGRVAVIDLPWRPEPT